MYKAIIDFVDLQDDSHKYHAGDIFPRNGIEVSKERLEELLTDKNRRHMPVIEEITEESTKVEVKEEKPDQAKKPSGRKKTDVK